MYSRIVVICTLIVAATAFRACHRQALGDLSAKIENRHLIVHEIKAGPFSFIDLSHRCPFLGSKHIGSEVIVCSDSTLIDIQLENLERAYVYSPYASLNLISGVVYCGGLKNE